MCKKQNPVGQEIQKHIFCHCYSCGHLRYNCNISLTFSLISDVIFWWLFKAESMLLKNLSKIMAQLRQKKVKKWLLVFNPIITLLYGHQKLFSDTRSIINRLSILTKGIVICIPLLNYEIAGFGGLLWIFSKENR